MLRAQTVKHKQYAKVHGHAFAKPSSPLIQYISFFNLRHHPIQQLRATNYKGNKKSWFSKKYLNSFLFDQKLINVSFHSVHVFSNFMKKIQVLFALYVYFSVSAHLNIIWLGSLNLLLCDYVRAWACARWYTHAHNIIQFE